jgi:hypothetical protein
LEKTKAFFYIEKVTCDGADAYRDDVNDDKGLGQSEAVNQLGWQI